uniref:ATPase subunit 6 n=1 Tax=Rhabdopleura compacta TaxID=638968 RepID=F8J481_RHACM|nr:ATPase subunit 6 [Rhabdopleura compacta]
MFFHDALGQFHSLGGLIPGLGFVLIFVYLVLSFIFRDCFIISGYLCYFFFSSLGWFFSQWPWVSSCFWRFFFSTMYFSFIVVGAFSWFPGNCVWASSFGAVLGLALPLWVVSLLTSWREGFDYWLSSHLPPGLPLWARFLVVPASVFSTFVQAPVLALRLCCNLVAGHILLYFIGYGIYYFLFSSKVLVTGFNLSLWYSILGFLGDGSILGSVIIFSILGETLLVGVLVIFFCLFSLAGFVWFLEVIKVFVQSYVFVFLLVQYSSGSQISNIKESWNLKF